jgi:hypothetical protein
MNDGYIQFHDKTGIFRCSIYRHKAVWYANLGWGWQRCTVMDVPDTILFRYNSAAAYH